jgi:hypothetical protein
MAAYPKLGQPRLFMQYAAAFTGSSVNLTVRMNKSFDVIVIGAGMSGSGAAALLAQDATVLVLEAEAQLPSLEAELSEAQGMRRLGTSLAFAD